jgi:uncharacterized protein (DUF302 family)
MGSFFIVETHKPFDVACSDLEAVLSAHSFGLLAVHDLGETLRGKGIAFAGSCRVFEVCNPRQAAAVLMIDMALNMALPCRISVYIDSGRTLIGMIKPVALLRSLSGNPDLITVAEQVEASTMAIIQAAACSHANSP